MFPRCSSNLHFLLPRTTLRTRTVTSGCGLRHAIDESKQKRWLGHAEALLPVPLDLSILNPLSLRHCAFQVVPFHLGCNFDQVRPTVHRVYGCSIKSPGTTL